jgi:hypothetical protein
MARRRARRLRARLAAVDGNLAARVLVERMAIEQLRSQVAPQEHAEVPGLTYTHGPAGVAARNERIAARRIERGDVA